MIIEWGQLIGSRPTDDRDKNGGERGGGRGNVGPEHSGVHKVHPFQTCPDTPILRSGWPEVGTCPPTLECNKCDRADDSRIEIGIRGFMPRIWDLGAGVGDL